MAARMHVEVMTAAELVDSRKLELEFDLVDPDLLITDRAGSAAPMTAPRADWGAVRELASFHSLADAPP